MASVLDVAAYILQQEPEGMSTWKLQKLVYYCQAWHLVWDEQSLYPEAIEAWANGPVVRELYREHRRAFWISECRGDPNALTDSERETIDAVLEGYGHLSGRQLSHLTHHEPPWIEARGDLEPTDRSTNEIRLETMQEFYGALDANDDAQSVDSIDWDDLGLS
jgi:uncharacterized phage-associated protein